MSYKGIIKNINKEVFIEFLHLSIDELLGRKGPSYDNFKSSTNWTHEEYNSVLKGIQSFLCDAIAKNLDEIQILEAIAEFDSKQHRLLIECLEVRRNDIKSILIQESQAISGLVLNDFDWKYKWVLGSSKMSNIRQPLVELDFHLTDGKSKSTKCEDSARTVSFELDKEELKILISTLEKAEESLTKFT